MTRHARDRAATRGPSAFGLRSRIVIGAALVALVLGVFGRTIRDGFIPFDDPSYVTENTIVQRGLTIDGVRWALSTSDRFYWHPLTWVSHMVDTDVYGAGPAGRHATNVALHAITAVLVFVAFGWMTNAWKRSAVVAALFAVHPLNVEPVAWIAERKALLAAVFWFGTLIAYTAYTRRPTARRYALVCTSFVLGLMSKPDVVTLPFVLLLLDVWPLARLQGAAVRRLIIEKLPLFALSAAVGVLTYFGQQRAGAMVLLGHLSVGRRLTHAVVAYGIYVRQFVWPHPLAILYPYPAHDGAAAMLFGVAVLSALIVAVMRRGANAPFLLTGCAWFVVTLLPMIGIVQVGGQSHADRFMYLPAVGLSVALVWSASVLLESRRVIALSSALAAVTALAVVASAQVRYWRDGVTLMTHTVAVTEDNPVALHLLAFSLAQDGRLSDAVPVYRASLRLAPINPLAWYNLGLAQGSLHDLDGAVESLGEAVRLAPSNGAARVRLGAGLLELRRLREARQQLDAALQLPLERDVVADAAFRLGLIAAYEGDIARARTGFETALRFRPDFEEARIDLEKASRMLAGR